MPPSIYITKGVPRLSILKKQKNLPPNFFPPKTAPPTNQTNQPTATTGTSSSPSGSPSRRSAPRSAAPPWHRCRRNDWGGSRGVDLRCSRLRWPKSKSWQMFLASHFFQKHLFSAFFLQKWQIFPLSPLRKWVFGGFGVELEWFGFARLLGTKEVAVLLTSFFHLYVACSDETKTGWDLLGLSESHLPKTYPIRTTLDPDQPSKEPAQQKEQWRDFLHRYFFCRWKFLLDANPPGIGSKLATLVKTQLKPFKLDYHWRLSSVGFPSAKPLLLTEKK